MSIYYNETMDLGPIIGGMIERFTRFNGKVVRIELSIVKEDNFDIIYSRNLE